VVHAIAVTHAAALVGRRPSAVDLDAGTLRVECGLAAPEAAIALQRLR
jgi:hypothetical protein